MTQIGINDVNVFEPEKPAQALKINDNFNVIKTAHNDTDSRVITLENEYNALGTTFLKADGTIPATKLLSYKTVSITGATNATPIVITAVAHGRSTGDSVFIYGVLGNIAANGSWTITKLTDDTFSLDNSVGDIDATTGNGAYTSGGTVYLLPSNNENLTSKAYVDNGDAQTTIPLGTCTTASYDLTLTGTVTATSGSATVTGTSTLFTTQCPVGSTIVINGTPCYVSAVASNTSLTISQPYANTTGTYTAYKANNIKVVTLPNFILTDGVTIRVLNTNKNYGYTPSFNVNNTGAVLLASENNIDVSVTNPCFIPDGCEIEATYNSSLNRFVYKRRVVNRYVNGHSYYHLYLDGWIEQGGCIATTSTAMNLTFLKSHSNTNYNIDLTKSDTYTYNYVATPKPYGQTTSGFGYYVENNPSNVYWETRGY